MKRAVLIILAVLWCSQLYGKVVLGKERKMISRYNKITKTWSSYPFVPIHDLQYVTPESLQVADVAQFAGNATHWKSQASQLAYVANKETVVTVGIVHVPAHIITYTAKGWTMLLHDVDTLTMAPTSNPWGGILVREQTGFIYKDSCKCLVTGVEGYPDTIQAKLDGFEPPVQRDVVMMTGVLSEFPSSSINSTTQFQPIYGINIDKIGTATSLPQPTHVSITDFNYDPAGAGYSNTHTKQYSTGEQWEGSLVYFTNLRYIGTISIGGRTDNFLVTDENGNQMASYDISHYWTYGNETPVIPGDPSFQLPAPGAIIDTLRCTIQTVSGGNNNAGYLIGALYPGDIVYGVTPPNLTVHRRYPVIVTANDSTQIQISAAKEPGGYDIYKVVLMTSFDYGPWEAESLSISQTTSNPDSNVYAGYILDQDGNPLTVGTEVRYFFKGIDVLGNEVFNANASFTQKYDTSKGFYYYKVFNTTTLSIHDVQYTPYKIGFSPYLGGSVTVGGIVTADTASLGITPLTPIGANVYYIQSGNAPWSGMWIVPATLSADTAFRGVKLGDSVVVYGNIQEEFDNTRIFDSTITIVSHNNPVPAPVNVTSGSIGTSGNGDPTAEQYEGMLVRMLSTAVTDTAFWTFADRTEYNIDDGSGSIIVRRDGRNSYGNRDEDTATGRTHILHPTDRVDTLTGIVYYGNNRYKIVPRTDADIVAGEPYPYDKGWNLISIGRKQLPASTAYAKTVLFPNTTSQAFAFSSGSGYTSSSVLAPDRGYWLKFPGARTVRQLGEKQKRDTVAVAAGWNLIGMIGDSVLANTITALPGGNSITSQFFGYKGGYNVASTLKPTKGYWVKVAQAGGLVVASGTFAKMSPVIADIDQFNSITITDKNGYSQQLYFAQDAEGKVNLESFEMPPTSPEGAMTVQFASGRILETYPAVLSTPKVYSIVIGSAEAPLTVSWNITAGEGRKLTLTDAENGKLFKSVALTNSGQLRLTTAASKLLLTVEGSARIPKEFSLGQNYPNPFNPSTNFVVGLPQREHLSVVVYNILGQKVATLADDVRDAGFYSVTWNGTTQQNEAVASGVYFVRMNSGKFTSVRKLLLMK